MVVLASSGMRLQLAGMKLHVWTYAASKLAKVDWRAVQANYCVLQRRCKQN
jgi:hypothetical protein